MKPGDYDQFEHLGWFLYQEADIARFLDSHQLRKLERLEEWLEQVQARIRKACGEQ